MAQYRLRILHISDLHERVALDWMDEERKATIRARAASRHRVLGDNFLQVLREIREERKIDLVCFTGDVADWGLLEEYQAVTDRINVMLRSVNVPIERTFIVPGNHDVQRKEAQDVWQGLRRLVQDNMRGLSDWMAGMGTPYGATPSWRDDIQRRTRQFWGWVVKDLGREDLHPNQGPHKRLGYRATVKGLAFPFPVHIVGLDSAWMAGDDSDARKLLLTENQVDLLTTDDNGKLLSGFRLALVHHALSDLADEAVCRRRLADNVDLLLHGHQHEPVAEVHQDPDRRFRILAAGSLYEGDLGDRWINSFHVLDVYLDCDGRPSRYDLQFWGWSDRGHWYPTGAIYKSARDGRLTWWIKEKGAAYLPAGDIHEILGEKVAYLQAQEALESGGAQRFELKQRIKQAKPEIAELEKDREHRISGFPPTSAAHSVFALPGTHRPNPHFTPLPEVHAALYALRPGDVLVLHGLGGVGKTQHAVQYAHEQRDRYSQILWASAESEQILRDALAALAELPELALPVETGFAFVENIRVLRRWFEGTENWLLILDNADSPEAARAIEGLLPSAHRGHVIITARVAEWTAAFRLQHTDAWDDAQSVTFLSKRLAERSPASVDLARLAQALGGLPLALEHAAAYISETHVAVDEYLRLLARDRKTLLARHYPGMTDYRASVVTTWHVTIRRLSFLSRYVLHLAACLSPDPIPRRLFDYILANASADYTHEFIELGFLRRALAAPNAIDVSLGELARYSLVALSEHSLRVHPLLQAVVSDSARLRPWNYYYRIWRLLYGISDKKAWKVALWPKRAAYLLSSDGVMPDRHSDVTAAQRRPYVPHIEAVLSHLPEELFRNFFFRPRLVGMLERHREYSDAVSALRSILAPAAEHSAHLKAETDWLFAHFDDLYQRAAEIEDRTSITFRLLRQDSEGRLSWTYDFLRSLSRGLAKVGDTTAARRLFQVCFDHATEADASHVESAYTRIDEAFALVAATPVEETRRLLEEGITLFEQHKGMAPYGNVIDAVSVYATVAETPVQRMRAVGWLQQLLPPAQQLLRHGVPHACYAAAQLVRLLKESGQMDEALAICEETLRVAVRSRRLRRLRAKHLAPLWEQRGSALGELGRSLAAARSYGRSLLCVRLYNEPETLRLVHLLEKTGEMFRRAGCLAAAESRFLEASTVLNEGWIGDPDGAEFLASLVGLGLGRVGRRNEGETLLRRSVGSRCARLGADDWRLALPHRLLGIFLQEAKRLPEAETELRHALVLAEKNSDPDNHSMLPALDSLATLLEDLQRHAEALPLRQRYLALSGGTAAGVQHR